MVEQMRHSLSMGRAGDSVGEIAGGVGLVSAWARPTQSRRQISELRADEPVVLFNGYLVNRDLVRRTLFAGRAADLDDAELYRRAYAAWGEDCDLRLIGEYAAIIWDASARRLTLTRSPIDAPPIYYWRDKEKFIAASAPRGIFATGGVPRELDEQKIADALFLNYNEEDRTWFRGVSRLQRGTRLTVTSERSQLQRYYDLSASPDVRLSSDEAYAEAAMDLLGRGVQAALAGKASPAISLSGGYDSQAVAAVGARSIPNGKRLHTFTSVPEPDWLEAPPSGFLANEGGHVTALAAMYPALEPHLVHAAGFDFGHGQDEMFRLMEMPPQNAMNLHWVYETYAAAARLGCDVMLTGTSGNATFSFDGRGFYPALLLSGHWACLLHELAAMKGKRLPILQPLVGQALLPLLPARVREWVERLWRGRGLDPFKTWCPLHPDWAREMHVVERAREMGFHPTLWASRSPRETRLSIFANTMNESGDIAQALRAIHGIESRDPTAYRPLVQFCMGLPDDQYLRHGERRRLAHRMLRGVVPDAVLDDPRRGLQAADWHRRTGRVRDEMIAELRQLARDPAMAARFNIPRLVAALADDPESTPHPRTSEAETLRLAVPRALTTARFIRYVQRDNWA